jgi:hypothetical protein
MPLFQAISASMLRIKDYPSSVDNFHGLKWYLIMKEFFLARVRLFVTYRLERSSERARVLWHVPFYFVVFAVAVVCDAKVLFVAI